MRLLHTSDWHIGRKFHQLSLLEDQLAFGEWLSHLIRSESIDHVLISGDLFDRASPAGDAVEALNQIFSMITSAGAGIIAISGNHDSGERLNFGSTAMAAGGLHLRAERPQMSAMGAPIDFEISGHAPIQIVPLPYIDPYRLNDLDGIAPQHGTVLDAVLQHRIAELHDLSRTIVMAHAFVIGGTSSDSERELSVGGTSQVSAELFEPFGYTALGHLHRPQQCGSSSVFYSGSPLAYSFSEEHQKSVRIIDVGSEITSRELPIDVGRRVYTLSASLDELLTSSRFDHATHSFVRARLTDPAVQLGAMDKLRARFGHICEIEQIALTAQGAHNGALTREMMRRSPGDLLNGYLEYTFPDLNEEDRSLIHQSFDRVSGSTK